MVSSFSCRIVCKGHFIRSEVNPEKESGISALITRLCQEKQEN